MRCYSNQDGGNTDQQRLLSTLLCNATNPDAVRVEVTSKLMNAAGMIDRKSVV